MTEPQAILAKSALQNHSWPTAMGRAPTTPSRSWWTARPGRCLLSMRVTMPEMTWLAAGPLAALQSPRSEPPALALPFPPCGCLRVGLAVGGMWTHGCSYGEILA